MLFAYSSSKGRLAFADKIDKSQRKESDSFSAMRKFKDMDKYRDFKSSGSGLETQLDTLHQNTITELRSYHRNSNTVSQLSSIALDGKMVIWDLKVMLLFLQSNRTT
jgi:actin related protein 2/3 complex subunit 1A/1B